MSLQVLREFITRHAPAAAGMSAVGALLDGRLGTPLDGAIAARAAELLSAIGAPTDMLDDLTPAQVKAVLAELRVTTTVDTSLLHADTRGIGWGHTNPAMLQSAGDTSAGFIQPLSTNIIPALAGLASRLAAPDAAFLDVGVGVASLSIAFARHYSNVRVTGIDPWQPSLALARANVAVAGLADRIELREQGVEKLGDDRAFDLAWIPTMFVPARFVEAGLANMHRALKPGGWALVNALKAQDAQSPNASLWRLRTTQFGNADIASADIEARMRAAGFVEVQTLPTPPGAFVTLVAGRRSE